LTSFFNSKNENLNGDSIYVAQKAVFAYFFLLWQKSKILY